MTAANSRELVVLAVGGEYLRVIADKVCVVGGGAGQAVRGKL
jgi:hypothetical protein